MLGFVGFCKQCNVRGLHNGRRGEIGNADSGGAADLGKPQCLYNIFGRARMGNPNGNALTIQVRSDDGLHVVIGTALRRKPEPKKFVRRGRSGL